MHRGTKKKLEGTAYHFSRSHLDLLKTRFEKAKQKLFTLGNARIAVESGYQLSMYDK